jgi:hypothetical protein
VVPPPPDDVDANAPARDASASARTNNIDDEPPATAAVREGDELVVDEAEDSPRASRTTERDASARPRTARERPPYLRLVK